MSEQDETLNILLNTLRVMTIALASATHADLGKVADVIGAMAASPQFDPKTKLILTQLAQEFGPMRSL